ncbi:PF11483 family protein [Leptospira broomii serovar Hurstbridge str. 5399]|uniref:PF11483 family protein n=2 Tax=Leptospira broomii TaxID=301541 RepID=T0FAG0_9LEPT|nr:PF11483 family protein [Leptospira broomii serovar Hurstbridge str. 5399]
MMNVLGIDDEVTRIHEVNEIGQNLLAQPGPIQSLSRAGNLTSLLQFYESSLTELEQKISLLPPNDPKLSYYRSLLILTKKVELELKNTFQNLNTIFNDLEEMHDFVHEIYPG